MAENIAAGRKSNETMGCTDRKKQWKKIKGWKEKKKIGSHGMHKNISMIVGRDTQNKKIRTILRTRKYKNEIVLSIRNQRWNKSSTASWANNNPAASNNISLNVVS